MEAARFFRIYFGEHALKSMEKRGAEQFEVEQAIREGEWREAKLGRFEAEKEFLVHGVWNGKSYTAKKVNPVFLIENEVIIVVTVYCFYYNA